MERAASLAEFERECRRRGLALTIQRRAVFEELSGRRDHPTADQIFDALNARLPGLSRTTVYRVLETLVEMGAARKVLHVDAVARFDPVTHRHHHLICERCGRLVDLEDDAVPPLALPDTRRAGFRVTDYSICFSGLCSACQKTKEKRA